jgi:hypothetical protein
MEQFTLRADTKVLGVQVRHDKRDVCVPPMRAGV